MRFSEHGLIPKSASSSLMRPGRQRGVGLIEVMIAVLILAIGMLGVAALQAVSLRTSQGSLERTQAAVQTYSLLDLMRANAAAARGGAYNMARTCARPDAAASLASKDLHWWFGQLQGGATGLGEGACATIAVGADGSATVTVEWNDSRQRGGSAAQTVTTETQI